MARSLNKVQLIGRLGRDPELVYSPSGTARATFSLATNRTWTTDDGELHEDVEWHQVVAWGTLAENSNQYLGKGRLVYVEGPLQTRTWETDEGAKRSKTEIVAEEILFLDRATADEPDSDPADAPAPVAASASNLPAKGQSAKGRR